MFKDLKLNVNLSNYSFETLYQIYKELEDCGIIEYINKRKDYDFLLKNGFQVYLKISYLQDIKNKYKRVTKKNIKDNDGEYLTNKLIQLSKYSVNREKYDFLIDGIIYNIYIDHDERLDSFYDNALKIFSEYCLYYDIFDLVLIMYPDPYIFIEDFTEIFKIYFDYVKTQLNKNTLKKSCAGQTIYSYMCADEYFPILKEQIENRLKNMEIPEEIQKQINTIKFIPIQ